MAELFKTDVCVIGSGIAGIMAALAARDQGVEVLVVCKGRLGKPSCTAQSGGRFAGMTLGFSAEEHVERTLRAGARLNHRNLVDKLAHGFPAALKYINSMGEIQLDVSQQGSYQVSLEEGSKGKQIPLGLPLVRGLVGGLEGSGARTITNFMVYDLIVEDGKCQGCWGVTADGRVLVIQAGATILATGGGGRVFARTDNPRGISGDGYAMAARAGAILRDMEFVQFHPLGLDEPGNNSQMVFTPLPEEARLHNSQGENIIAKYFEPGINLSMAAVLHRDSLSIAINKENIQGKDVYIDLTGVPGDKWGKSITLMHLQTLRFNFRALPAKVKPIVHFCCGGLAVDENCLSSIPGLYAAGEVAGGAHGANRMGGNALTECLVFGIASGRNAAEAACCSSSLNNSLSFSDTLSDLLEDENHPGVRLLDEELRQAAWMHLGPARNKEGLEACRFSVRKIENRLDAAVQGGLRKVKGWRELSNMILVTKMINEAAIRRTESRGAHYREDFPQPRPDWEYPQYFRVQDGEIEFTG